MKKILLSNVFLFLFVSTQLNQVVAQDAFELTTKMISTCKSIKTLTFTLKKEERVKGKMVGDKAAIKLNVSPLKVYYKEDYPRKGLEMLYLHGENDNNSLINTNGFPWVNVSLSPYGSQMRENQHHTVHKMGLASMAEILGFLFKKYEGQASNMVKMDGSIMWDGNDCWIISMENPNFEYIDYTVAKGETLNSIASKFKLSEHMILEKNSGVDDYDDVSEGQKIKIPKYYAKKMKLYLDKKRSIPLVIQVFDDQGLYENYEYFNLKINPVIKPEEFTQEYDAYGF